MANVNIINAHLAAQGSFLVLACDSAGTMTLYNSTRPPNVTPVPIRCTIPGLGTELTILGDRDGNYTYTTNFVADGSDSVPILGAAAGVPSSILINAATGTVTAGAFTDTLTNILNRSGSVPANTLRALTGAFAFTGEDMTPVIGYFMQAGVGAFEIPPNSNTDLKPPVAASTKWSSVRKAPNISLDATELIATMTAGTPSAVCSVASYPRTTGGKRYFEVNLSGALGTYFLGIGNSSQPLTGFPTTDVNSVGWNGDEITLNGNRLAFIHTVAISSGQTACIAIDFATMQWWHRVGEVGLAWWGSAGIGTGDPVTAAAGNGFDISPLGTSPYFAYAFGTANGSVATANFGPTAFAFAKPTGYSGW